MEYRVLVQIDDLPLTDDRFERVIEQLEERHGSLGPVMSWDTESIAVVTVSLDRPDKATAGDEAGRAVSDALRVTGLGDHFARVAEVYPTADDEDCIAT